MSSLIRQIYTQTSSVRESTTTSRDLRKNLEKHRGRPIGRPFFLYFYSQPKQRERILTSNYIAARLATGQSAPGGAHAKIPGYYLSPRLVPRFDLNLHSSLSADFASQEFCRRRTWTAGVRVSAGAGIHAATIA